MGLLEDLQEWILTADSSTDVRCRRLDGFPPWPVVDRSGLDESIDGRIRFPERQRARLSVPPMPAKSPHSDAALLDVNGGPIMPHAGRPVGPGADNRPCLQFARFV